MSTVGAPLELEVVVSPAVDVAIGGTFSRTTATLAAGQDRGLHRSARSARARHDHPRWSRAARHRSGKGDISHSTVLHVPSIAAVVAGDVVYNGVHQMLGVSGPDDWGRWIESVDKVAALDPKVVLAGNKREDCPTTRPPRFSTARAVGPQATALADALANDSRTLGDVGWRHAPPGSHWADDGAILLRCWFPAADAAEAEVVGNALMDLVVEREVSADPPRVLVPVLADVEVAGVAPSAGV